MNIRLRIATPQDAQLIHDTYGHYVLTSTATFNEVNSSVEARAEEIRSQLELYPWLIAEDETGRRAAWPCTVPSGLPKPRALYAAATSTASG
ncbi:MAG: hypothetical protein KHX34_11390 [Clostridiales bacterium]|nr:hypothetical protein [Clostridiales bacterium]